MIVLIRINSAETMHNPPLGLLYVGDALKKAGYEVKVYHLCEDDIYEYVDEIIGLNPIWVGLSVNTGWSMNAALALSGALKKHSQIPTVWGNAHPSLLPQQCLAEDAVDYVVIGEGEVTAVELTRAFIQQSDLYEVKGIGFKDRDGSITINEERELIKDLDQYEMDWSLLDPEKYVFPAPEFGMNRAFQFITSRGCPHRCAFCFNQRFNRGRWRAHSEAFVTEKVLELKESLNLDGIRFWDDNFFTNKNRAFSILEQVDLPYTAEIRVDYFDEDFAERLNKTQCRMVLLGLESGSDRILKLIKKDTTVQTNWRAHHILLNYPEIAIHPSVIVGFPTETIQDYQKTLNLLAEMIMTKPNFWFVRLGIYVPYPGAELFDVAIQKGLNPPETLAEWDDYIFDTSKDTSVTCVDWLGSKADIKKDEDYLVLLHDMVRSSLPYGLLCFFVQKRIKNRYYKFPIELGIFRAVEKCKKVIRSIR